MNKSKLKNGIAIIILSAFATIVLGAPIITTFSDDRFNTAGGSDVLQSINTAAALDTGFGYQALYNNAQGARNSAFGAGALFSNVGGSGNTAVGADSLNKNVEGQYNTAVGGNALERNTSGHDNVAIGYNTLVLNETGANNTATGLYSLGLNKTGSYNTANGHESLMGNITGNYNAAFGYRSLLYGDSVGGVKNYNTASGSESLMKLYSGNNNLALGRRAGFNLNYGNNNVYIMHPGYQQESGNIRIGQGALHKRVFFAGIRGKTTKKADAVPVVIDSNGQLGTIVSSARFKKDIQNMKDASRKLMQLRPVTYRYKDSDNRDVNVLEYGLIAEEVAKVYPDLVVHDAEGKIETVQYQKLTPMLLNEWQRMAKENLMLKEQLFSEVAENKQQKKAIEALTKQMTVVQTQAQIIKTLSNRLARLEAGQMVSLNR
jgi:hypothetical protein